MDAASVYPYNNLFDPTSEFDISFDPNASNGLEDDARYDAFDPVAAANAGFMDQLLTTDFDLFIDENGIA